MRKKIGFLFQSGALYDSMTVKENLEFPLKRIKKGLSRKEIDAKVEEVLDNVGLGETLYKMPSELSGGMRKRVSLARTIIVNPMIMLYDEPTTGLDPVTSDEISELINEVKKKYKTSSIIITHDIECARATADRIIMIQDGEVYQEGSIEEFNHSKDPLIKSVDNIRIINDSTVQVDLLIKKDVQQFIKADSEAGISSEGIIGDRVVMITQGSFKAPMAQDGEVISSIEPIETDEIMANLQSSAVNADVITKQLAEIMVNINTGEGVIGRLIQDSTMAENINLTIANLKKSSEGIDETIEITKENLFEFMEKLQLTVATTEIATMALGEIMVKINSGEGTLGMLIQDTTVGRWGQMGRSGWKGG
jgi:ABC-type multidrug transport system ATPase subunit